MLFDSFGNENKKPENGKICMSVFPVYIHGSCSRCQRNFVETRAVANHVDRSNFRTKDSTYSSQVHININSPQKEEEKKITSTLTRRIVSHHCSQS